MNAADFGAYTSRNRLFGCFAKHGLPIVWPKPTHGKVKKSKKAAAQPTFFDMQELKPWKAVRHVLDLQDEGISIFARKKPLSDRTLDRIYAGLVKFVAGGKDAFMLKYNSTSAKGVHHPPSIDEPCPVIATQNRLGVAFITKFFSGRPEGKVIGIDGPAGTITTVGNQAVVSTLFIQKYHGNGDNLHSVEAPCPTLATKDQVAVVKTEPFIMNPSHGGNCSSINGPCPVLIARQDKSPLYVATPTSTTYYAPNQVIYATDSDVMKKIKEFMTIYNLSDIKMRMLKVAEMLKIQGFPDGYVLKGNQQQQKKFIGNSVEPGVVNAWISSFHNHYQCQSRN